MGIFEGLGFGIFGGILAELIKWYKIKDEIKEKGIPERTKCWLYWVITISMILAGGGMVFVYIYSGALLNAFVALHVGAATPLILSGLLQGTPDVQLRTD